MSNFKVLKVRLSKSGVGDFVKKTREMDFDL